MFGLPHFVCMDPSYCEMYTYMYVYVYMCIYMRALLFLHVFQIFDNHLCCWIINTIQIMYRSFIQQNVHLHVHICINIWALLYLHICACCRMHYCTHNASTDGTAIVFRKQHVVWSFHNEWTAACVCATFRALFACLLYSYVRVAMSTAIYYVA